MKRIISSTNNEFCTIREYYRTALYVGMIVEIYGFSYSKSQTTFLCISSSSDLMFIDFYGKVIYGEEIHAAYIHRVYACIQDYIDRKTCDEFDEPDDNMKVDTIRKYVRDGVI